MTVQPAWFMQEDDEDPRLPHHLNPKQFVSLDHLVHLGVLHLKLNPKDYENDAELPKIREDRGYNYMDLLDLCPEKVDNYDQKLKNFFTEHIHASEEIRYCLEGSGYFDVRDKEDRWIRIWPIWTAFNRPQEDHPARQEYAKSLGRGVALEAH